MASITFTGQLCRCQNCFVQLLQVFKRICCTQSWIAKPLPGFGVVKTGLLKLYRLSLNRHSNCQYRQDNPLQAFNYLAGHQNLLGGHLQGFNKFCSSQTWLAEQLQAFNQLWCCQNCCIQHLPAFNRLFGSQNSLARLCSA